MCRALWEFAHWKCHDFSPPPNLWWVIAMAFTRDYPGVFSWIWYFEEWVVTLKTDQNWHTLVKLTHFYNWLRGTVQFSFLLIFFNFLGSMKGAALCLTHSTATLGTAQTPDQWCKSTGIYWLCHKLSLVIWQHDIHFVFITGSLWVGLTKRYQFRRNARGRHCNDNGCSSGAIGTSYGDINDGYEWLRGCLD